MVRKRDQSSAYPISIRLPRETFEDLDEWIKESERKIPGLKLSRHAAIVILVKQALAGGDDGCRSGQLPGRDAG